jgi:hypothetical protein
MTNINIHYKITRYRFKEYILCFIAGLCCIFILLYADILLYPLVAKVLEYLNGGIGVLNNAVRGCYR